MSEADVIIPDTWHTLDTARASWDDAPDDDELLLTVLEIGKEAVVAYAPTLTPDEDDVVHIPVGYREAQLRAARNSWNDMHSDPQAVMGQDGFEVPAQFFRWHHLVRPPKALPTIA